MDEEPMLLIGSGRWHVDRADAGRRQSGRGQAQVLFGTMRTTPQVSFSECMRCSGAQVGCSFMSIRGILGRGTSATSER